LEPIKYVNEHLLPGQIGHILIVLGFVASVVATLSYFYATREQMNNLGGEKSSWKSMGRASFLLHSLCVFGVIGIIFYIMLNQYFEYWYAFEHVSKSLDRRYIFSAFWEGQEGSFLLWMFWHVVLGLILMFRAKEWETSTLTVVALVQVFLSSMILGLYFGPNDFKIGSNPLALVRDVQNIPLFANPNYQIPDGQGLNALLQNYWMTIHPPTLFLGFASTLIPFAYAIAGLWTGQHKSWIKPVLPWALFSGAILGTGILMGGAWAYEALSFGGYWAWDPVENMSLVPWLVLIAGIHTALVSRATGYSIKATYVFMLLTFIMIIYSTFLTRSGVLGDTSVHAFTEMGLEWQLVIFLLFFIVLSIALYFSRRKGIPTREQEEALYSREFWMFVGALVLIFSSVLITFTTSIPVYNKVATFFNPNMIPLSPPEDIVAHYNKYQIWIAVFIGLLAGTAQFLRYKEQGEAVTNRLKKIGIRLGVSAAISIVLTWLSTMIVNINAWQYLILMWASIFAILVNADYLVFTLKKNWRTYGSALSHIGFGIMIIGTMASGLNKDIISAKTLMNVNLIEGFNPEDAGKNVLLRKNLPTQMGDYLVTYYNDTIDRQMRYFDINYKRLNDKDEVVEEFNLRPNILYDKGFTKIEASNPSTKHYVHKDIFTHISALPRAEMEPQFAQQLEDSLKYVKYEIGLGDTTSTENYSVIFQEYDRNPITAGYRPMQGDIAVGAKLLVKKTNSDSTWTAMPVYLQRGSAQYEVADKIPELKFKVKFSKEYFDLNNKLDFKSYNFKQGETIRIGQYDITFENFNKEIDREKYGIVSDVAVGALLRVKDTKSDLDTTVTPIFFLKGNQSLNIPEEIRSVGMKFQFASLDPSNGTIMMLIANDLPKEEKIIVEIAENALHDYVVLQAIVFPGINLFWLGSIMMMVGLAMSMWKRYIESKA
jgi:cytochrome c-type biogenesis protein CcmF